MNEVINLAMTRIEALRLRVVLWRDAVNWLGTESDDLHHLLVRLTALLLDAK